MRQFLTYSLLLILGISVSNSQTDLFVFSDPLEQEQIAFWTQHKAFKNDILESLLIAEGNTSTIARKSQWLTNLEQQVLSEIGKTSSPTSKAEDLYEFLHDKVLRKYSPSANMLSLIANGEFNCVTSSALYAHLASTIDLPVIFHATPFHVAPVIDLNGKKIWVELTDPNDGYDAELNQEYTVEWLIVNKFVLPGELREKGSEQVFNEYIGGHFRNSIKSLLGYHYYNHALALSESGKTEDTFWALAKAVFFESEDKQVNSVYDYAFLSVSTECKSMKSYHKIVKSYLHTRGIDSTNAETVLLSVAQCVQDLLPRDPDFAHADSILSLVSLYAPKADKSKEAINRIRQILAANKAIDFSRRGHHRESFTTISPELSRDPNNTKIQDLYAEFGISYARNLLTSGKGSDAINLLDSMLVALPDYARLREVFVGTSIANVMMSGQYRTAPLKAREALFRAYKVDSTHSYLLQSIAGVYHELAMAEVRKNKWRAAKRIILEGLRFVPDHSYLLSDLELVEEEMRKQRNK